MKIMTTSKDTKVMIVIIKIKIMPAFGWLCPDYDNDENGDEDNDNKQ